MRIKVSILAALSGLSLAVISTPAMAGGCGYGAPVNCNAGVNVIPTEAPSFGPMTVANNNPLGHLRTINFQRSPHVSITRIHGMAPTASLADAPSGFTGGCHPSSTQYCRANAGQPVSVQLNTPIAPAPVQQLRTWVGKGYDPSKFAPRQYGDNTFTPGIAHIPTSIVDRSPINAQAALNSGRAVSQPIVSPSNYNFAAAPSASYATNNYASSAYGSQPSAPVAVGNGIYGSNVGADGTYWEKTSGPTMLGSAVATQVICKRQLPRQVVNPIINVPVAVPTPVAIAAPVCRPVPFGGQQNLQTRYGAAQGSSWVN